MAVTNIKKYIAKMTQEAKAASRKLASQRSEKKNKALERMADCIIDANDFLQEENEKDLRAARKKSLSSAMIDRLALTEKRIEGMAQGLREVAALRDPVGEIISGLVRPNGLKIHRVRVPLGVVAIIYESRPNVTADAAGLCLKSGNAVILRGGSEAIKSNMAIHCVLKDALDEVGLDTNCIQLVSTTDREAIDHLLNAEGLVDVVIPRGGEGLIRRVVEKSKIPVIKHYQGICHVYVDQSADLKMARNIAINAKVQRPGVCNALETLLVHKKIAAKFLPQAIKGLQNDGVEIRGCSETRKIVKGLKSAKEEDWSTEYLDLTLAIKVVASTDEAIDHINTYGSSHTDSIITTDVREAEKFVERVDSSSVMVNASTRFADGGEYGMGAEIGISTDKLHARGPMGLEELTTYKFVVHGDGHIRK